MIRNMVITADGFKKRILLPLCVFNLIALSSAMPTSDTAAIDNEIADAFSKDREEYAKKMLTYMNRSVDPCDDFYEYACGNWPNVIEEHNDNHKRGNLLDLYFHLNKVVEEFMQMSAQELQIDAYDTEWEVTRKFYQSCLQADMMPMRKSDEYLNVIRSVGGFPAVDPQSWNSQKFDWFNMSAHLTNYGIKVFISEESLPQYPFFPYFKLPELGFDISVHSDNIATNTSNAYVRNEQRMVEYLKTYDVDPKIIPKIVEEIFDLWHAILNVTESFNDDFENCQLLEFTDEDEKKYEGFKKYYDIAWKGNDFRYEICNHYYIELDRICNERKEAAANYMALKFLFKMDARLNHEKFHKEYCNLKIWSSIPYLIDNVYLKKYFDDGIRDEIHAIVSEIRYSLRQILQDEADWLDEATRKEAIEKESTIVTRIGAYMGDETLKERLIREMANLTYTEDNYEANNLELTRFKTFMNRYLGLHHKEMNNVTTKPLELLRAMQVNAFYYNLDNSINVMAGILYPPVYDKSWPNSLKFGTIGYLIGHEFTHGFDTIGGLFDSTGQERSWWSKKAAQVFEDRANCYVKHYSNYFVPQINRTVNGNLTKDENIADSGGLRESLTAYRRFMKDQTKELGPKNTMRSEQMPGLDLSPEQIFFLGFSQLWCASLKEEHYWELLTNEHTIDKYRVLGALTNYEEFAKVYNCPAGSKMNPSETKCRLW